MSAQILSNLINDADPKIRESVLPHFIDDGSPETDRTLFNIILNDDNERVVKKSAEVLINRNPWLMLKTHSSQIDFPDSIKKEFKSPEATVFFILTSLMEQHVKKSLTLNDQAITGLALLHAILPEIIDILNTYNYSEYASRVESESNLHDNFSKKKQILFCPTYRCNISCDYCYAKDWIVHHPEETSIDELYRFFDYLSSNNFNSIVLGGGEPTVYRYFNEMLTVAKDKKIDICLTSNGLYDESLVPLITEKKVKFFVAHYNDEVINDKKSSDKFISNVKSAVENGVHLFFRYTIIPDTTREDWGRLIKLAKELNISRINYAFAFKNYEKSNIYVDQKYYESSHFRDQMRDFVADCVSAGLRLKLCKPLPLCSFDRIEFREYVLNRIIETSCAAFLRKSTQNITVNPDFTTYPCNSIAVKGKTIYEYNRIEDAYSDNGKLIDQLLVKPYAEKCNKCFYYYSRLCQGVCLAEKNCSG